MLLSASTFDPNEKDLLMPGIAMSKAKTDIQTLFDQSKSKKKNTTTLKIRITQNAKPKTVVQMKCCGLM